MKAIDKIKTFFAKARKRVCRKKTSGELRKQDNSGSFYSTGYQSARRGTKEIDPIETFRKMFAEAYPDGEKFISLIKELNCGDTSIPVLALNAHFIGEGSVSARGVCAHEIAFYEAYRILEDRRHHGLDVSGVRINASDQNSDFVIELRFADLPSSDKRSGE